MRQTSRHNLIRASLLAIALLVLAGCGTVNRVATLNYQTPGTTVATNLQKQLAAKGFPSAKVSCAKTLVVNVGATAKCTVTGAGTSKTVKFSFTNPTGKIKVSSVKVS